MRRYMQGFRRLADRGATVLLLHNSGKSDTSKDYRGSSDIKASIDAGYHLSNTSSDPSVLTTIRMRAFKCRFTVLHEAIFHYQDGVFRLEEGSLPRMNHRWPADRPPIEDEKGLGGAFGG
jgi:hypothetical protein